MSNMTIQDSEKQFNEYLHASGKAQATIVAYTKDIEQLTEFLSSRGKVEITGVSATDLEAYKNYLIQVYRSDKTVSRKVNSVKSYFRYLADNKFIPDNPSRLVSQPACEQTQLEIGRASCRERV